MAFLILHSSILGPRLSSITIFYLQQGPYEYDNSHSKYSHPNGVNTSKRGLLLVLPTFFSAKTPEESILRALQPTVFEIISCVKLD